MGGSKQKATTQSTVQSTVPQWVSDGGQQTFNSAKTWMDNNPVQPYAGERSAPASDNQVAASSMAAATANAGQADIEGARRLTSMAARGQYQPVFAQNWNGEAAQQYMSPYASNVRDNTLRKMDQNNLVQQRQVDDSAQGAHAFGGDRHAILMGEVMRDQNTARNDYVDQSNQSAYNDAASRWQADRAANMEAGEFNSNQGQRTYDRILSAGGQMGNLGTASGELASRGVGNLLTTGMVDQDVRQRSNDAAYQDYLRTQTAPLDRYNQLTGILSGVPINRTTTENGTQTSQTSNSLGSSLLGIGAIGASMFQPMKISDRRLKRDIRKVGELAKGIGLYAYRYLWPSTVQVGVMADEVGARIPEAVELGSNGFFRVNYGKLMEAMA